MNRVTVVMPVLNGEAHVAEAVASILRQTLRDFELLVIDDGSSDQSAAVVEGFRDPRVRVLRNPTNLGVIASLNRGLDAAESEYVARMDADDVSLPERLERQVAFLEAHRDVGVLGTRIRFFGQSDGVWDVPADHASIRCHLLFGNALAHPTVMLRAAVLRRHGLRYDARQIHVEDYDLWVRCAEHTRLENLPEPLLRYRVHAANISIVHTDAQTAAADLVRARQLVALGIEPTREEAALHGSIGSQRFRPGAAYLAAVERWLIRLEAQNRAQKRYVAGAFRRTLAAYFHDAASFVASHGSWVGWRLSTSPLTGYLDLPAIERALLLLRGARANLRVLASRADPTRRNR